MKDSERTDVPDPGSAAWFLAAEASENPQKCLNFSESVALSSVEPLSVGRSAPVQR